MVAARVQVDGLEEAKAYFAALASGAEAARRALVLVGSPLRYARYQEFGTKRLAGRLYLTRAARELTGAEEAIAGALDKGPSAVLDAFLRLGYRVQRAAQGYAPVKTGSLRRSIHTVAARR
jgi:hypothetical protein